MSPVAIPRCPQWYGSPTWCTVRPSTSSGPDPLGHEHACLDRSACGHDRRPAAVLEPALGGERRAHLAEHLGLELGQVGERARHGAGGVVLGQPVGRDDVWVDLPARGVELVVGVRIELRARGSPAARRAGSRTATRAARSGWGAGRRRSPAGANSHPRPSACITNGASPRSASSARGAGGGFVIGRHVGLEVGHVRARPAPVRLLPPHVALALRPRPPLRGRRTPGCRACAGSAATPIPTRGRPRSGRCRAGGGRSG